MHTIYFFGGKNKIYKFKIFIYKMYGNTKKRVHFNIAP